MTVKLHSVSPRKIEAESFRIIEAELGAHNFNKMEFPLVRRVIHATGDFSFATSLLFHPQGIAAGIKAIKTGKNILADVNMAAAGINKNLLTKWGGKVLCGIDDPEVIQSAKDRWMTRSETAIEKYLSGNNVGIVTIGNAPTALLKVMALIDDEKTPRPRLVIGVPVGFVNAAEAKTILGQKSYPFITNRGRKGGSAVAAAIINGLLHLAAEE